MSLSEGQYGRAHGRRGMTLIETLLASMVTALVAMAGSALLFAVTNASTHTRDVRNKKNAGRFVTANITRCIRQARAAGVVTPNALTLWYSDRNDNDAIQLREVCVIRYDAASKQVTMVKIVDPANAVPATPVSQTQFKSVATIQTLMNIPQKQVEVWGEDIDGLSFSGYPNNTDTRIVDIKFIVHTDAEDLAFHDTASPRAPADYLFVADAVMPADSPCGRKLRKATSRWDGFDDLR